MRKKLLILFFAIFCLFVFASKGLSETSETANKIIMYRDKIPIEIDYDKGVLIVQGKEIPIIIDGDVEITDPSTQSWVHLPYERFDVYVEEGYYDNNTAELNDYFDKFEPRYELMESITDWSSEEFYGEKLEIYVEQTDNCFSGYALPTEAHVFLYYNLSDQNMCKAPYYENGTPCYNNPGDLGDHWKYMTIALHESLHAITPLPILERAWFREGWSEYYGLNILSMYYGNEYPDINQETADYYLYNGWIIPSWYNWEDYVANDYHDTTPYENEIQESPGYDITAWMFSMLRDDYSLPWSDFYEIADNNPETMDKSMELGDYYTDTHVIDLFERAIGVEMYPVFRYDGPSGPGWGVRNWESLDWYADLTPELSVSDTTPQEGQIIDLNATINNNGDVSLEDVVVRFYSNTDLIDEQIVDVDADSFTIVSTQYEVPGEGTYEIKVVVDEDNVKIESDDGNNEDSETINASAVVCGDVKGDGDVNITDIMYFINYLLRSSGKPPLCPEPYNGCADTNGDGETTISDIVYLINYVLKSGPEPICS